MNCGARKRALYRERRKSEQYHCTVTEYKIVDFAHAQMTTGFQYLFLATKISNLSLI